MDNLENECEYTSGTLCGRSLKNPDEEPTVIDTEVDEYLVFEDSGKIVYVKNEEFATLYEYDIASQEAEKVFVCTSPFASVDRYTKGKYLYLSNEKLYEKAFGFCY